MSTDTTIDTEALGDSVQTSLNTLFHSGWESALRTIFFCHPAVGALPGGEGYPAENFWIAAWIG